MPSLPRLFLLGSVYLVATPWLAPAWAQPAPRVKSVKAEPATEPFTVVAKAGTGVGVFQDIQVPVNERFQMRGDGKLTTEENADHAGFPFSIGLGAVYRPGAVAYEILSVDALVMRASTGPTETQSSSYSRLGVTTGAKLYAPLGDEWTGSLGLNAGARRSSFTNISSSHFVEAALVGGSVSVASKSYSLSLFGAYAPAARFGYSEDPVLGGETFDKSTARLWEAGVTAGFAIAPRVSLETGIEQEAARVTVDDLGEYGNFGLAVEDSRRPTRVYDLATTIVRFGLRKEF